MWAQAPSEPQAWVPSFPAPLQARLRSVPMTSLQDPLTLLAGAWRPGLGDRIGVGGGLWGDTKPRKGPCG